MGLAGFVASVRASVEAGPVAMRFIAETRYLMVPVLGTLVWVQAVAVLMVSGLASVHWMSAVRYSMRYPVMSRPPERCGVSQVMFTEVGSVSSLRAE